VAAYVPISCGTSLAGSAWAKKCPCTSLKGFVANPLFQSFSYSSLGLWTEWWRVQGSTF
jgi:hypothetical protein